MYNVGPFLLVCLKMFHACIVWYNHFPDVHVHVYVQYEYYDTNFNRVLLALSAWHKEGLYGSAIAFRAESAKFSRSHYPPRPKSHPGHPHGGSADPRYSHLLYSVSGPSIIRHHLCHGNLLD